MTTKRDDSKSFDQLAPNTPLDDDEAEARFLEAKMRAVIRNAFGEKGPQTAKNLRFIADALSPDSSHLLSDLDKPMTLRAAAEALGVGYHTVQRSARKGLVPTLRIESSRRYVRLRDFIDLMNR